MANYYATGNAIGLGSCQQAVAETVVCFDSGNAFALGIGAGVSQQVAHIPVGNSTGLGVGGGKSSLVCFGGGNAGALGIASGKSSTKARSVGGSTALGSALGVSETVSHSGGTAKALGSGQGASEVAVYGTGTAKALGIGSGRSSSVVEATGNAVALGVAGGRSASRGRYGGNATALGSAGGTSQRGAGCGGNATAKGSGAGISHQVATGLGGNATGLGIGAGTSSAPVLTKNLITACRYWCFQTFPEIASKGAGSPYLMFPEATAPMGRQMGDGDLPMCAIIAGAPIAWEQAVNDNCQRVQIDFVYVSKSQVDGATDPKQYVRGRLNALKVNMLRDFQLKTANGGMVLCQDSREVSDPLQTVQQYQAIFNPDNVNVTALTLSFQFDLVLSIYKI
jgi:hypothetical protein